MMQDITYYWNDKSWLKFISHPAYSDFNESPEDYVSWPDLFEHRMTGHAFTSVEGIEDFLQVNDIHPDSLIEDALIYAMEH